MTHRQRVGLLVIGVALVLVVAVAGRRPHFVAGSGEAGPIQGPPVVGDCVLDPVPGPLVEGVRVTATSGGTVPVYPAQQIRPCTGTRYGEITAVIAAPKPAVVNSDNTDNRYLDDLNKDSCVPTAVQYVGMTTQPTQRFWQTLLQIDIGLSRPSPRQAAAGQRWAACIVTLQPPHLIAATAATAPAYGSSIRNALHTGRQRDQLSDCTADWVSGITVGCGQPHAIELLAYGDSGDRPVARVQVELTCQRLVGQLTAMPDPAAGGALSIQVRVQDNSGAVITTPQVPAHSNMVCAVSTTDRRNLRGSLLALGRQPIPWA